MKLLYTYISLFSDVFDPEDIVDCLRFNVGDVEECQKFLTNLMSKINKANELVSKLRAMGHHIDDDYMVGLNIFDDE